MGPSGLFPSGFLTKILHALLMPSVSTFYIILLLEFIVLMLFGEEHKL
jgi:hypothetical protein